MTRLITLNRLPSPAARQLHRFPVHMKLALGAVHLDSVQLNNYYKFSERFFPSVFFCFLVSSRCASGTRTKLDVLHIEWPKSNKKCFRGICPYTGLIVDLTTCAITSKVIIAFNIALRKSGARGFCPFSIAVCILLRLHFTCSTFSFSDIKAVYLFPLWHAY